MSKIQLLWLLIQFVGARLPEALPLIRQLIELFSPTPLNFSAADVDDESAAEQIRAACKDCKVPDAECEALLKKAE